jgi:peptidyl-tRNA hydrolase, PTH1 family
VRLLGGRGRGAPVDFLIAGLGNPGSRHAGTRHNVGFETANELGRRWELPRARKKFAALVSEGRAGAGGPRVALMLPQTYMNESGSAVGPARGHYRLDLDQVIVIHDEIDLPFGEVQTRKGGGLAGHNGLKSVSAALGGPDFLRVRVGVGRPQSTDSDVVAAYVLSPFAEPKEQVRALIERAADAAEELIGVTAAAG